MQYSVGLVLDALRALREAGAEGLTLSELSEKLWPKSDAGARKNSGAGALMNTLWQRGLVAGSPGRRQRFALTAAGKQYLEDFQAAGREGIAPEAPWNGATHAGLGAHQAPFPPPPPTADAGVMQTVVAPLLAQIDRLTVTVRRGTS